jgi:hypothetical protein
MRAKTDESPSIKSNLNDVAEAVAAVKRDLIGELPRMRRSGRTDASDLEVSADDPAGTALRARVALRTADGATPPRDVPLAAGEALAVSTVRAGRSPLDPRTGRPPQHGVRQVIVRARSCAVADAWAVACLVRGSGPPADHATAAYLLPLAVELVPAIGGAIGAAIDAAR